MKMKRIGFSSRALLCWLILVLGVLQVTATPTKDKRAGEELHFGNQQNLPIGLLDDTPGIPGTFPSSESLDSSESVETTADSKEDDRGQAKAHAAKELQAIAQQKQLIQRTRQQQAIGHPPSVVPSGYPPVLGASLPRSSGGMHLINDWRSPHHAFASQGLPTRRRRAAVTVGRPKISSYQPGGLLSTSRRPKRTFQHRYRRDITAGDLNNILREVDVVELLQALGRGQQQQQQQQQPLLGYQQQQQPQLGYQQQQQQPQLGYQQQQQPQLGYPSLSYGQHAPRFAPQPALFPEYREEEPEEASPPPGTVGRMWRRSGFSSGLSRVPGFKRSSPPIDLSDYTARSNDNEVYSLAAMLGAESDPRTQRIRRVAM